MTIGSKDDSEFVAKYRETSEREPCDSEHIYSPDHMMMSMTNTVNQGFLDPQCGRDHIDIHTGLTHLVVVSHALTLFSLEEERSFSMTPGMKTVVTGTMPADVGSMDGPSRGRGARCAGEACDQVGRLSDLVNECENLIEMVSTTEASLRETRANLSRRREKIRRMLEEVEVLEQDVGGRLAMQSVTGE